LQGQRWWHNVVLVGCFACAASAQNKAVESEKLQTPSPGTSRFKKAAGPILTAEQKRGLRLLKGLEAQSAGLEPPMQTFILWQVSHGFRKIQPKKADVMLQRAFTASCRIQDQDVPKCPLEQGSHLQIWLQREILLEMMQLDNGKQLGQVEKLLPQAASVVKTGIIEELAKSYLRNNNLGRARELLDGMDPDSYSYGLAGELMAAIPASRGDERLVLFVQALRIYENQDLESQEPDDEDFGILVTRFWRDLPRDAAISAVNTILDRSKQRDEKKKVNSIAMTLYSGSSLTFGSEYEYRLFQLLPILRELDESKAEQLLKEHTDARTALDRYPQGMQSIDPNYFGEKQPDMQAMPAVQNILPSFSDDPAENSEGQAKQQLQDQINAQMMKVYEESQKDPEEAYQDALNLPLQDTFNKCPRASGLRWAAFGLAKKNPSLAKTTMNEMPRLAQDVDPTWQQTLLASVPEFYLSLDDDSGARSAIKDQVKLAEKLYALDTDSSDPNLAFKGAWPSANAWRTCIQQATKVSPSNAEELLQQIPDPEISGFERVIYANSLLGVGKSSVAIAVCHKDGKQHAMYMSVSQ
jgi:hypothetical protein